MFGMRILASNWANISQAKRSSTLTHTAIYNTALRLPATYTGICLNFREFEKSWPIYPIFSIKVKAIDEDMTLSIVMLGSYSFQMTTV